MTGTLGLQAFACGRAEWYVLLLALQATDVVASLVVSLQTNGKDVYVNR